MNSMLAGLDLVHAYVYWFVYGCGVDVAASSGGRQAGGLGNTGVQQCAYGRSGVYTRGDEKR